MANTPIAVEEARWAAESDAYTLAEADRIYADPKRLKAARSAAVKMAKETQEKADSFKQISSNTVTPKQILKKRK